MAKLIRVKCGPGILRFPFERNPKRYITDKVVDVTSSVYYRRALKDGDLVLDDAKAPVAKVPAKAAEPTTADQKEDGNV